MFVVYNTSVGVALVYGPFASEEAALDFAVRLNGETEVHMLLNPVFRS